MTRLKIFILLVFALSSLNIFAQEVTNIVTNQIGDNIEVSYKITNSNSKQIFNVSLYCSIDGGERIMLKSVSGDVGENISGGKEKYIIIWDVLKDVDELNSAEFFVKIELTKDESKNKPLSDISQKKWVIGYNGSFLLPFGLRASYLGKWGFSLGLRFGTVWNTYGGYINYHQYMSYQDYVDGTYIADIYSTYYPYWDQDYSEFGYSINLALSKRVINKDKFQLHSYLGLGLGYWGAYHSENYWDYDVWVADQSASFAYYNNDAGEWGYHLRANDYSYSYLIYADIDIELGLFATYKRATFNLGFSYSNSNVDMVFGLGYKF